MTKPADIAATAPVSQSMINLVDGLDTIEASNIRTRKVRAVQPEPLWKALQTTTEAHKASAARRTRFCHDKRKLATTMRPTESRKRKATETCGSDEPSLTEPCLAASITNAPTGAAQETVNHAESEDQPKKIKLEPTETRPFKDEDVPIKTENQADRLQELSEANTRLSITVRKLSQASAKHVDAYAKLADSYTKLTEQFTKSTGNGREEVEAKQAERIAKLEAEVQKHEAAEASEATRVAESRAKVNVLEMREQTQQDREKAADVREAELECVSSTKRHTVGLSVYEKEDLDLYGTGRVPHLPTTHPYFKKLTALFGRKASAMLAYQPLSEHPGIPQDVLNSTWKNQPIVHWFAELDAMCLYLGLLPDECKDELVQTFIDRLGYVAKDDPESWLDKADGVLEELASFLEPARARGGWQVNRYLARKPTQAKPASTLLLQRRRLRRFRALRREEILPKMLAEGLSSKAYRLARLQARMSAVQEDFDDYD